MMINDSVVVEDDRLKALLRQEETAYRTTDYLTKMQRKRAASEKKKKRRLLQQQPIGIITPPGVVDDDNADIPNGGGGGDNCSSSNNNKRKSCCSCDSSVSCHSASSSSSSSGKNTKNSPSSAEQSFHISKHWREQICKWAYQVVDYYVLNRGVVSVAMNYLDRYLGDLAEKDDDEDEEEEEKQTIMVDKNRFKLLAMTCLYLAIKLNEHVHIMVSGCESSMETMLLLGPNLFQLEEMESMERRVLDTLGWRVHPPSTQLFVRIFLDLIEIQLRRPTASSSSRSRDNNPNDNDNYDLLLRQRQELCDLAQFITELSVVDYFFVSYRPSQIAISALLNAIDRVVWKARSGSGNEEIEKEEDVVFVDFSALHQNRVETDSPEIRACRERLSFIYRLANDAQQQDESSSSEEDNDDDRRDRSAAAETTRASRLHSPVSVMNPL